MWREDDEMAHIEDDLRIGAILMTVYVEFDIRGNDDGTYTIVMPNNEKVIISALGLLELRSYIEENQQQLDKQAREQIGKMKG